MKRRHVGMPRNARPPAGVQQRARARDIDHVGQGRIRAAGDFVHRRRMHAGMQAVRQRQGRHAGRVGQIQRDVMGGRAACSQDLHALRAQTLGNHAARVSAAS
ncbi:hypothetical protein G6F65_021520 [Rhizopus arrhizus]|nr:hypothetical protein G6F65_021520 [Rhizopus arrhizus]